MVYRRRLLHGEQVLDDAGEIGDRDQFRPLENVDNRLRAGGPMLDR